jgi:hypothetical protein
MEMRVPTLAAIMPLVMIGLVIAMGSYPPWAAAVLIAAMLATLPLRLRLSMKLDHSGVTVTRLAKRHIAWSDVIAFERSGSLAGGVIVMTRTGRVRSATPCSRWGGRADERTVALLERIRVEQSPRVEP